MTKEELLKVAKPILFNTEMVRAILDGRKTATRRALKVRYKEDEIGFNIITNAHTGKFVKITKYDEMESEYDDWGRERIVNPPCSTGDILYVRETWNYGYFESDDSELDNNCWFIAIPREKERYVLPKCAFIYKANFTEQELGTLGVEHKDGSCHMDWHPSIHMPKEAARIFLKVTDVRVERLQDIDDNGVVAEGLEIGAPFEELWDSTIPKKLLEIYGWDANPWVWVIEFERIELDDERRIV